MSTVQEIEAAIETLSYEEQEQLAQWLDARRAPPPPPPDFIPASHQAELDSRWAAYKAGKMDTVTPEEAFRLAELE